MQFTIPKSSLLAALRLAAGVADRKSTQPILGNVLLRVSKKSLLVAATDLNVSLSAEVAIANDNPKSGDGALTLPAKTFLDIVTAAPGDTISVKRTDNNWAEIKSGRASYKLVGLADRDFPKLPDHREATYTTIDAAILRTLIARTLFSVCEDETRHHLNGVMLTGKDSVTAVSTDGHRLSAASAKLPFETSQIIVPRKGLLDVKRLIADAESCSVAVAKPHLFVRVDGVAVAVKLIDGQFPPWEQVVPRNNKTTVVVGRERLIETLRRSQQMTTDTRGVKLSPAKDGLLVESEHPDTGAVSEELDAEVSGKMPAIGFNPKYMVDLLAAMSSDSVTLRIGGELDPILVEQTDDNSYSGVVMPMRV